MPAKRYQYHEARLTAEFRSPCGVSQIFTPKRLKIIGVKSHLAARRPRPELAEPINLLLQDGVRRTPLRRPEMEDCLGDGVRSQWPLLQQGVPEPPMGWRVIGIDGEGCLKLPDCLGKVSGQLKQAVAQFAAGCGGG